MKIKELAENERPRERLSKVGVTNLSDSEVLALVIQTGSRNQSVIELSSRLISQFGLLGLSDATIAELKKINGVGSAKAMKIIGMFEINKRVNKQASKKTSQKISMASDVNEIFYEDLKDEKQENVFVLCLDNSNCIITSKLLFKGTLNESVIHPREIFKEAVKASANSIILVHNHPSNNKSPSPEDIKVTTLIKDASEMMGIKLLDHIIISKAGFFSFREKNMI